MGVFPKTGVESRCSHRKPLPLHGSSELGLWWEIGLGRDSSGGPGILERDKQRAELEVTKVVHNRANVMAIHETSYHSLPKGTFPASLPCAPNGKTASEQIPRQPAVSPPTSSDLFRTDPQDYKWTSCAHYLYKSERRCGLSFKHRH